MHSIYFARHGETVWNVENKICGMTDSPLTEKGRQQARELGQKVKESGEKLGLANITLNDIILFAVSRVLAKPEHKALNAHLLNGDTMRYFNGVHLGVAVDTDRGLVVPTIKNAQNMSLNEISAKAKELGSDYIVVGRPITQAEDPVAAYRRCVAEFVG